MTAVNATGFDDPRFEKIVASLAAK